MGGKSVARSAQILKVMAAKCLLRFCQMIAGRIALMMIIMSCLGPLAMQLDGVASCRERVSNDGLAVVRRAPATSSPTLLLLSGRRFPLGRPGTLSFRSAPSGRPLRLGVD